MLGAVESVITPILVFVLAELGVDQLDEHSHGSGALARAGLKPAPLIRATCSTIQVCST